MELNEEQSIESTLCGSKEREKGEAKRYTRHSDPKHSG